MLELENALGGEPGPGLGADSDFDKRQLEKVKISCLAVSVRHQTEIIMIIDLKSCFCLRFMTKTILSDQVGSGSPAQRVNPFAPAPVPVQDFSNGGGISAAGKAENSLLGNTTAAAAVLSSSSRDSSRRRRPSGKQVGISGIQLDPV